MGFTPWLRRTVLVGLVLLGVAAVGDSAVADACPSLKMLVVTGSGEHSGYGHTLGSVVSDVFSADRQNASAERIEYPAVSVTSPAIVEYNWSVGSGINALVGRVKSFVAECGSTPLFLLGYSQGAQVVGDAYLHKLGASDQAHVTGIALLGDPEFWGGQNAPVAVGTYNPFLNGIATAIYPNSPLHRWPASAASKVRSYCIEDDPVCSYTLKNAVGCFFACTHIGYAETFLIPFVTYTDHAAKFILSRWSGGKPPPSPPTPQPKGAPGGATPIPAGTWAETAGGSVHTWTNPATAGGTVGPGILPGQTVGIACRVEGFVVPDGNRWWYRIASSPWNGAYYASADAFYNNGQTVGSLLGTPFVDDQVPFCTGAPPSPPPTVPPPPAGSGPFAETTGGVAHTWTNYLNAGGADGPSIPSNTTVGISCRVAGFQVADGNTWWYRIASAPWNNAYYVSADAFYNNGQTSGSLIGTPFVDPAVPLCEGSPPPPPPPATRLETTGGVAHTWTNYLNAGGTEGPSIPAFATVEIACRLTGFRVADGNTWWYRIASAPWNNAYYVSADAFYNNGQTSGTLIGTPFVDEGVATC